MGIPNPKHDVWLGADLHAYRPPAYHWPFIYFSSHPFLPRMSFWRADIWDSPALSIPSPRQVPEGREGHLRANEGPLTVGRLWQ